MNRMRTVLLGVAAIAAVGCIEGQREIKVEADGSGRIEDTVKAVGEFAEMMKGFAEMDEDATPEDKRAAKEEKAREAGNRMGPGVTLVSFEEAEDGTEKTVFAFEDVTQISISETPNPPGAQESGGDEGAAEDAFTFRLEREGDETTLVLVNPADPEPAGAAPSAPPSAEEKQQMIGMFKGMFEGARIRTLLTVGGEILETNSPHQDGSSVTLLEVDFDTLLADPASVEAMATSSDRPSRTTLAQIQGVKVVEQPELTIRFRK